VTGATDLLAENLQLALFPRSEERADERSNVGVSRRRCICVGIARIPTHPLDASLELPSLLRKEGGKNLNIVSSAVVLNNLITIL